MSNKILTGLILMAIITIAILLTMVLTKEEDTIPPEVLGVESGIYNEPVSPTFNEGTAELNSEEFASGTAISTDGTYVLEVTDDNGNTVTKEFIIDQTAPSNPAVEEVDDQAEDIDGTAEKNSKVKVWSGEQLLAAGNAGDDGSFSLPIAQQAAGSVIFIAAIDSAGNQSEMSRAEVRDVTAPNAPEVAEVSDRLGRVEGQAESGATVFVYAGGEQLAATEAEEEKFAAPVENMRAGQKLTVYAEDEAGNRSDSVTVTIKDRTAPSAPEVNAVTDKTATVSGIAETGAAIQVYAGDTKLGETTSNADGAFEMKISQQTSGTNLAFIAIDEAGNKSETRNVTVTGTRPQEQDSGSDSNGSGESDQAVEPTYINGILVVNKKYGLPPSYAPGINPTAQAALNEMMADARSAGHELSVISSYRSYSYQQDLYNRYVSSHGEAQAKRFAAQPGHSEHQTGLTFDLGGTESQGNWLSGSFGDTPAGKWLAANAHKYGFIVRYPKGKEAITGYIYEPWHFRYLGVENATKVYNSGLTLEEFLGISGS